MLKNNPPLPTFTPGALPVFPTTKVGASSTESVRLTNNGGIPMTIGAPYFFGRYSDGFSIPYDTCSYSTLLPGNDCIISISFSPSSPGGAYTFLQVPTSDKADYANGELIQVLQGTGIAFGAADSSLSFPTAAGPIYAMGLNQSGELGFGGTNNASSPALLTWPQGAAAQQFVAGAAGAASSLGLTAGGQVYSWGWNNYGELVPARRSMITPRTRFRCRRTSCR